MILPRLIRAGQAHTYLGVSREWFTEHVRPNVREAKVGQQGIVFDRLDLDRWADAFLARNGRVGPDKKGSESWAVTKQQDFARGKASGTSMASTLKGSARFTEALKRAMSTKQSASATR